MRIFRFRFVAGSLVLATLCQGSLFADNPFAGKAVVSETQTESQGEISAPAPITQTLGEVKGSNAYASGDYQGFTVSYAIIKATIKFDDSTKNVERLAWFQQILSEHGVRILKLDKKQNQTGNIFNRKKWISITAEIAGRGFVVKAIKDYYGGTISGNPDEFTASTDAALKPLVALELQNRTAELAILKYSFEVDKLLVERSKLGVLDLSSKKRIDKALEELKGTKIAGEKAKIAAANDRIRQGLSSLAQKALSAKEYQRAIDLVNLARDRSPQATLQVGDAYQGLKQYDKAIEQYKSLLGQSGYAEKAELGIADSQHLKGDDRQALDAIYRILGNFQNSPEELAALARVDQWKLLKRSSEFPEAAGNISSVYVQKGLLNATSAHSTAVGDYRRAVEIQAAGGSKAEASGKIISEYSQVKSQYQGQLSSAQQAAGKDFDGRRERSRGQYEAWKQSHTQAVSRARVDYGYELQAKRRALSEAKNELDYLTRNPPARPSTSGGGTDPYGNTSGGGSGTDPYSNSSSKGSTTDPYGSSSGKSSSTDPYEADSSGNSGTDPYESANRAYQDRLGVARAKIDRLQREYNWMYYNEEAYVAEKTSSEKASLEAARTEYNRYDLANRPAYIANNAEVRKATSLVNSADKRLTTLKGLAQEAGY